MPAFCMQNLQELYTCMHANSSTTITAVTKGKATTSLHTFQNIHPSPLIKSDMLGHVGAGLLIHTPTPGCLATSRSFVPDGQDIDSTVCIPRTMLWLSCSVQSLAPRRSMLCLLEHFSTYFCFIAEVARLQ